MREKLVSSLNGEEVQCLVRSRGVGYAVADMSRACLIRLIDFPEMPLRVGPKETVKAGRTALMVRTELPVANRLISVAYKRIRRRNWWKRLTAWLRPGRVLHAWRMGHELRLRGIATPRPLAVIVPRRFEPVSETFFATEWITGSVDLHTYCEWLERIDSTRRVRPLRLAPVHLGQLLGLMHREGIRHRDLKSGNLLIADRGGDIRCLVVDLDGASISRRVPRRVRLRNLARLVISLDRYSAVTRSAQLRCLRAYLAAVGDDWSSWKSTWRELAELVTVGQARKQKFRRRAA